MMTLGQIVDQLSPAARVRVYCLSGEKFELMALMAAAAVSSSIVGADGGYVLERYFCRIVDGVPIEVVYRRPATEADVDAAAVL